MNTRSKKFKLDFMQIREAKDVTREQLLEIIDYVPGHIHALENREQIPSVDLLFQLAEMFGVPLDWHIFKDRDAVKSSIRELIHCWTD